LQLFSAYDLSSALSAIAACGIPPRDRSTAPDFNPMDELEPAGPKPRLITPYRIAPPAAARILECLCYGALRQQLVID
jgi:hypothetical protein